jgi:hypothetical protein
MKPVRRVCPSLTSKSSFTSASMASFDPMIVTSSCASRVEVDSTIPLSRGSPFSCAAPGQLRRERPDGAQHGALGAGHAAPPVHAGRGGLIGREQERVGDRHVRRPRRHEEHDLGDVVGAERGQTPVHGGGALAVAVEAHLAELRLRDEPRIDARDPHPGSEQVEAQPLGQRPHGVLRRAVDVAAGIDLPAGERAQVDHHAAPARHEQGNDRAIDVEEPLHVRVDHLVPVLEASLVELREPARPALFTSTSIAEFARGSIAAATAEASRTSSRNERTSRAPSRRSSPASASIRSTRRAARRSVAPSRAKARAQARPNPLLAPVTKTT